MTLWPPTVTVATSAEAVPLKVVTGSLRSAFSVGTVERSAGAVVSTAKKAYAADSCPAQSVTRATRR